MGVVNYIASLPLSRSSLSFNNQYIEQQIPGFRVKAVTGRQGYKASITRQKVGKNDLGRYDGKELNVDPIAVEYSLTTDTLVQLTQKLDLLKLLLSVPEAKVIFNDEKDKYQIGSVTDISVDYANTEGSDAFSVSGTISIDVGFKYSVTEYVPKPDPQNSLLFVINYKGSYKSYPIVEITMKASTEQVSITNNRGAVLTFNGTFIVNEKLTIDTQNAKVLKTGVQAHGVGDIKNKWEDFFLLYGENKITCAYKTANIVPDFVVKYREVFL